MYLCIGFYPGFPGSSFQRFPAFMNGQDAHSANGYRPSTENGGIVPYHDMSRNRSGKMKTSNMANLLWGTASQNSTFDSSRDFSPAALREKYAFGEPSLQGDYSSTRSRSMRQRKNIAGG